MTGEPRVVELMHNLEAAVERAKEARRTAPCTCPPRIEDDTHDECPRVEECYANWLESRDLGEEPAPCCDYRDHSPGPCACPDHLWSTMHPFGDDGQGEGQ